METTRYQLRDVSAELAVIHARGTLSNAESFAWHRELLAQHAAEYDPRVRARIEIGANQSAADYATLLAARNRFITSVGRRIAGFHALLIALVNPVALAVSV